jgi:hypothetical protein
MRNFGVVYDICMDACKDGTQADSRKIISRIQDADSPDEIAKTINKAIMDHYDNVRVFDDETEVDHFVRVFAEIAALEEAKDHFEKLSAGMNNIEGDFSKMTL